MCAERTASRREGTRADSLSRSTGRRRRTSPRRSLRRKRRRRSTRTSVRPCARSRLGTPLTFLRQSVDEIWTPASRLSSSDQRASRTGRRVAAGRTRTCVQCCWKRLTRCLPRCPQDLDLMNDQMVTKLRQDMETAANEDIDENERGSFAFHKLQMLDRVVETLQKCVLALPFLVQGDSRTSLGAGLLLPNPLSITVSSKS